MDKLGKDWKHPMDWKHQQNKEKKIIFKNIYTFGNISINEETEINFNTKSTPNNTKSSNTISPPIKRRSSRITEVKIYAESSRNFKNI